jgi:prephenate dehydrogenase
MKVIITIIGLGKIGTSIGLGLKNQADKVTRYGHDIDFGVAQKAKKLDAVDKTFINLPSSVEKADLVIMALPMDQIFQTLQIIAPCLRENAVVMDTAPMKNAVARWTKELLPPKRYYVGLFPSLNPEYDLEIAEGIEGARNDLFTKGMMAITAPRGTDGAAIKLAADFSSILGANPFFMDVAEADIINSYIHILPQIVTATFANLAQEAKPWSDAQRIAGPIFTRTTHPLQGSESNASVVESIFQDKENAVRLLDELIHSLQGIKEEISTQRRKKLESWFEQARIGNLLWQEKRHSANWESLKMQTNKFIFPGMGKRLFGDLGKLFRPPSPKHEPEKTKSGDEN